MVHEPGPVANAFLARAFLHDLVIIERVDIEAEESSPFAPRLPKQALITDEALRFGMSHDRYYFRQVPTFAGSWIFHNCRRAGF